MSKIRFGLEAVQFRHTREGGYPLFGKNGFPLTTCGNDGSSEDTNVKQDGFTLVELIVVTFIIGTILTIATLNFRTMTIKSNIESQIKQMHSDLMTARIEAMDRNTYHFVTLNANQYTVTEDKAGNCTTSNCVYVAGSDPVPFNSPMMVSAILWNGAAPANAEIIFDNRGLATVTGTISVSDTVGASYDCILVETTRTSIGAMSGGNCVAK
ncbi:MAG: type II secretion system protein [Dissulfurispiraceae bacterium]